MRTNGVPLGVTLGSLRGTLLAACGLSLAACTPSAPTPPTPETKPDEPFTELEPGRDGSTASAQLCANPTPVLRDSGDTGYVQCADGAINRVFPVRCVKPITAPRCIGTEGHRSCTTDAECGDAPHGFCMHGMGQIGEYCSCIYPCLDDSECATGQACICPDLAKNGPSVSMCAPAECKSNADCPSGECGASIHFNGCGHELSLQCREAGDSCRSNDQCEHGTCSALVRGEQDPVSFKCESLSCVIGRPLTVEHGVRVAGVAESRWGTARLEGLGHDQAARARAAYWLGIARMEHASVASFARFVNELLGFGAPPNLLADALAAADDEVHHAELTFAVASAYAGQPLGPGALQVDDLHPTRDPELFVTRLIVEGCVGETLGVAETLALLEHDLDPVLRAVVERIAADETRHAALAWRTLKWFAARVDPAIIDRAFERALSLAAHVDDEAIDPNHGRLGRDSKRLVRGAAIASVIEPCRQAVRQPSA
jgi:hypothetical protein